MAQKIKVVVVGDGAVGKTCLLWAYSKKEIPPDYVPTVFDNYVVKLQVNGQDVNLQLWDTAGQEDLENIRVLSYTNTDIFLVCFSVVEPTSLTNVQTKWLTELKQYTKDPKIILVGTKKDLRNDEDTIAALEQNGQKPITPQQGKQKAQEIKAIDYAECSAMTQEGVKQVFDMALTAALRPPKKSVCTLL
ncbi:Cdc42 [Histomonas meleagridis]|uniref:Cdc42-like n=1 Tax=Histomonas meleagridis TaxID=135588 RepID=UPI0035595587|nr:Cdc42 [Histomonas meleagridis]KAH0803454.1 Cdc42-like [Histomonas meleagridis]